MSLIDIFLHRRKRTWQPCLEILEERQCLSVAAPTGLTGVALSTSQIKLTWNDITGELGYRVYQWNGVSAVLAGTVAKNVTTFTVKSLPANQSQWFQVEAFDLSTTARSAWISVATVADSIKAPTNLKLTSITQTTMTLQWTNAAGATSYNIYSWDGTRSVLLGTTTPNTPAFKAANLTPGTVYYFYVQSINNTNSATSDWVSGTTTSFGIGAPTNVKAQVISSSTIGLSWKDVTGETGYRIYEWDGNASTTPTVVTTVAANTTGYQVTGLVPGKAYWFYVQAFNGANSANSTWVNATTVAALPLQPPTQVKTTVTGAHNVTVSWVEPARAAGYLVFVWNGYMWNQAANVSAGTHSVPLSGLPSGYTNWFYVEAYTTNFAEIATSGAVFANL